MLWNELPEWQQDNHYITSGYRPATNSYNKSFASISYLHNESVNIWTHLIGASLAFLGSGLMYTVLAPRYESATREDIIVFSCFFLGAIGCLGMSATYHTISNHSPEVAIWGNKLDYLGIVFLIWGSFIPVLYYGFQSEPQLMKTYAAMVCHANPSVSHAKDSDHNSRGRHLNCIRPYQIPHPGVTAFPRTDVCAHGSVGRLPGPARFTPLRVRSTPYDDWSRLVAIAGFPVHPGCWNLRRAIPRTPSAREIRHMGI